MKRVRDLRHRLRPGIPGEPRAARLPAAAEGGRPAKEARRERARDERASCCSRCGSRRFRRACCRGRRRSSATRLFEELMARSVPPARSSRGFTPRRIWSGDDRSAGEGEGPLGARGRAAGAGGLRRGGESDRRRRSASPRSSASSRRRSSAATSRARRDRRSRGSGWCSNASSPAGRCATCSSSRSRRLLKALTWAKTMRWGTGVGPWVRPLHGIVALLDGEVLPFELFGIAAGRATVRPPDALAADPSTVAGVADWRRTLARARHRSRSPRRVSRRCAPEWSSALRRPAARWSTTPELLGKLAAICEIPGVMEGRARAAAPRAATRGAGHLAARPPERPDGGEGRRSCCPSSSPSWTAPTTPPAACAPATSGSSRRASPTRSSSGGRTERLRSKERTAALDGLAFHPKLGSYAREAAAPRRALRGPRRDGFG